ncbi:hypothetical protein ACQP00_06320 [Dactylosporangium sp. CS-047395]|uniref:hypothetical protein n=1 Tax=Dactylosporangium sp. CS-047395 TaxID=3239936 RepID=UPI003D8A834F
MRLDIGRILTAHRLDPSRKELYVEGVRDKSFLDWLVPVGLRINASIVLICNVEVLDAGEGGERSRLLKFLRTIEAESVDVHGLVDADSDPLSAAARGAMPSNAWVTDLRDLESYVLSVNNIRTALQLGFARDPALAPAIFASMAVEARWLAALRLTSEVAGLRLPVSEQKWLRHAKFDSLGTVVLDRKKILTSLLQSAGLSLKGLDDVILQIQKTQDEISDFTDREVLHGKDALALLTLQLREIGCNVVDVGPVLWTTFRHDYVSEFPNLSQVVSYLKS